MHSAAYIALPGGYGTLDELFEVMTLVQTRKVPPAPIILIGTEFWSGLIEWLEQGPLANHLIAAQDIKLFTLTDDLDLVMRHIEAFCAEFIDERQAAPALPE